MIFRMEDEELQTLRLGWTTWHVTFGAHAARLHGGVRATVDREHNQRGMPFVGRDEAREQSNRAALKAPPVTLSVAQSVFIEAVLPTICERGGWVLRTCAASPPPIDGDHVHVLLDALPSADPGTIRELIKRWLTQALNKRWPVENREAFRGWWAEGGSTKPVKDAAYLNSAFRYVKRQRATKEGE
jgi:hypothetical protein